MTRCPSCQTEVGDAEAFCEACGAELSPTAVAVEPGPAVGATQGIPVLDDMTQTAPFCEACGGDVAADGYCGTCGARATSRRDHFSEQPEPWVAAVCDRGIRHTRNEDAVALSADSEQGSRAVLVVCDGVSNTTDSDLASLAAARAARDVLTSSRARGMGTEHSLVGAVIARLGAAADAASDAVLDVTKMAKGVARAGNPIVDSPASCTFVAAVVEQGLLVVGSVGDSRAYWLPDAGPAIALTIDDSFAQEQIAAGVPRDEAEAGPQAHAITRWLGSDAPDHTPTTATMTLAEPGWLLVCSDGLWNYCSEAQDLATLVHESTNGSPAPPEPLALADSLVDWANSKGGQDNITVALARFDPASSVGAPLTVAVAADPLEADPIEGSVPDVAVPAPYTPDVQTPARSAPDPVVAEPPEPGPGKADPGY